MVASQSLATAIPRHTEGWPETAERHEVWRSAEQCGVGPDTVKGGAQ